MEDLENATPEHHAVISDWICSFHRWMLSNDRKEGTARAYTRSMVFLYEEDQKSPAAMASQEYFELTKASLKNKIGNGQRSASVRLWKMFFEEYGHPTEPPEKSDGSKLFQVNLEAGEARKTSTPQNVFADENSAEVKKLRNELELPGDWSVAKRSRNSGDLLTAMSPGGRIYTSKQAVDVRLGREPTRLRKESTGEPTVGEGAGEGEETTNDTANAGEKRKRAESKRAAAKKEASATATEEKDKTKEKAAAKTKASKEDKGETSEKDKDKEKKAKTKKEKKEKKDKKDKKDKKEKKQKKKEKKEQKAAAKAAAAAAGASSSSSSSDKEDETKDPSENLGEQVAEAARGDSVRRVVPVLEAWGTAVACANVSAGRAYDERQLDAFLLRGRAPEKTLAKRISGLYVQQELEICGRPYFRKADSETATFVQYHEDKKMWRITSNVEAKGEFGKVKDKNDVPWKAKKTWKIFDGKGTHLEDEDVRVIYMDAEALPVGEQVEICLPVLPESCFGAVTTKREAPPPAASSKSSSSGSGDESDSKKAKRE